MIESERTRILIPGGEIEGDVINFLRAIGLDFTAVNRRYLHRSQKYTLGFGYFKS